MAQTSINIKSKARNTDKDLTKAITFVNSEADNADLAAFGTALNALTTNSYVATNRVDKSNCDTEQGGGSPAALLDPQLSITGNGPSLEITRLGEGSVSIVGTSAITESAFKDYTSDLSTITGGFKLSLQSLDDTYMSVYLASDGTYAAAFATYGY